MQVPGLPRGSSEGGELISAERNYLDEWSKESWENTLSWGIGSLGVPRICFCQDSAKWHELLWLTRLLFVGWSILLVLLPGNVCQEKFALLHPFCICWSFYISSHLLVHKKDLLEYCVSHQENGTWKECPLALYSITKKKKHFVY